MPAIPEDRSTKESYTAVLLMLAEADNRDHKNEIKFINHVAIRLGFNYQMVDELIDVMRDHIGKIIPQNLLLDIIKRYMN
jgi:hypothetical protein